MKVKPISLFAALLVLPFGGAARGEGPKAAASSTPNSSAPTLKTSARAPKTSAPAPALRPLDTLNDLTRLIVPKSELPKDELATLVDVAEAIAARDNVYAPTAQGVLAAAGIAKGLDAPQIKKERALAVLVELALSLARLGGPDSERYQQPFYLGLLGSIGVKAADAQPRPALARELAEIGAWAATTVERVAPRLPPDAAARARVRLAFARGKWNDAESLARAALTANASAGDPRWQAYLAAALVLEDRSAAATPFLAAAKASGGEAEGITRAAHELRARLASTERAGKAFKLPPTSRELGAACKKFYTELADQSAKAKSKSAGDLAIACANVLWEDAYADWVQRAVEHLPSGSTGFALRAAYLLRQLFGQGVPARPDESQRAQLLERYLADLAPLPVEPGERRLLALLGHLAAAAKPIDWRPGSADEQALLSELETRAPCDSSGFVLRSVANRADRAQLGVFLGNVARTCSTAPGGAAITVDALELLLQMAHETPSSLALDAAAVEAMVASFARAHGSDPQAITLHADAVALHELSAREPRAIGLEAALSRYEEAIAHSTPASGPTARSLRESNAAFLSLALGRLAPAGSESRRAFVVRAANHLRIALAFGETLPAIAVRVELELLSDSGVAQAAGDLTKQPPGRARSRATCMLAREASLRGDRALTTKYLALAFAPGPPDERKFGVDALVPDTAGTFKVVLDDKTLRPLLELKTSLYLAPACDPTSIKPPASASGARSTPAPRTGAGKIPAP